MEYRLNTGPGKNIHHQLPWNLEKERYYIGISGFCVEFVKIERETRQRRG